MSLDTEKIHRLKGKSFDNLHAAHPKKWKEMVDKAREYAQTCVGAGEKVRIGDVVAIVADVANGVPHVVRWRTRRDFFSNG